VYSCSKKKFMASFDMSDWTIVSPVGFEPKVIGIGNFGMVIETTGRSQWPHGLRHGPSLAARTLESCIRIPLEAWMSMCVYSAFVLYVSSGLVTG
jgi:hypothetical protein